MMKRFCVVMLCAVVLFSLSSIAFAQEIQGARPMFRALPPHGIANAEQNPAVALPQWTFSSGVTPAVIVGTDPSKTNTTTTIPVGIIPIKMVYGPSNGNKTFDPNTTYVGIESLVSVARPINHLDGNDSDRNGSGGIRLRRIRANDHGRSHARTERPLWQCYRWVLLSIGDSVGRQGTEHRTCALNFLCKGDAAQTE